MKQKSTSFFTRIRRFFGLWGNLIAVSFQLIYGFWKLTGVPGPFVTIFGSARLPQDDFYSKKAHELANMLVENDISVLTGGGPGIMEAASCGANSVGKYNRTVGIGVTELGEGMNPCVQEYIELKYFFARKWLLTRYSIGFIVFPGGFGTLDELGEILTLVGTNKLPKVPIVLFGKEYWEYFMKWLEKDALVHGMISESDLKLFRVTDDIKETCNIIHNFCKEQEKSIG